MKGPFFVQSRFDGSIFSFFFAIFEKWPLKAKNTFLMESQSAIEIILPHFVVSVD